MGINQVMARNNISSKDNDIRYPWQKNIRHLTIRTTSNFLPKIIEVDIKQVSWLTSV